jgi:hypothetical protein
MYQFLQVEYYGLTFLRIRLGCPQVSNSLLWWTPDTLPSPADLSNYTKIGGWDRPYAKLYGVTGLCSTFIFASYYEG